MASEGFSSPYSYEDLNWDDNYICENLDSVISTISKCLENSEDDLKLKAISISLGPCLQYIPVEELEERVLYQTCSCIKTIFANTINGIENFLKEKAESNTQTDVSETVSSLLQVCLELVSYLNKALDYLLTLGSLEILHIKSLPMSASEVLHQSYKHCQNSNELYEIYFDSLSEILTNLFRNGYDVQCQLIQLLSQHIQFNCENHMELSCLDVIMSNLSKSACIITKVDVKAMADLWKGYTNLATKYALYLKSEHEVAQSIQHLCSHVTESLESMSEQQTFDIQIITKTLKILCFVFKIIYKLCELFCGYLGDCHGSILNLLLWLNQFSRLLLNDKQVPAEVIVEVTKQLTIGSEPLLALLLTDRGLISAFLIKLDSLKSSEKVSSFVILCCCILKRLLQVDAETRKLWFNSEANILKMIFIGLQFCYSDLTANVDMASISTPGQANRMKDIYEQVLTSTAAFVITLTAKEICIVEKLLLQNILRIDPMCALLAMDLWCLLARFADASLCHSQLLVLCKLLIESPNRRIETTHLTLLVSRLSPLLLQEHRDSLPHSFPPRTYPRLWGALGTHLLTPRIRQSIESEISLVASERISKFLSSDGDPIVFEEMEQLLIGLSSISLENQEKRDLIVNVLSLWKFDVTSLPITPWTRRFLRVLCDSTLSLVPVMESADLLLVVTQLRRVVNTSQETCYRLSAVTILSALATHNIPQGSTELVRETAALFHECLLSGHVIARQRSLETFCDFARRTNHADIIAMSVSDDETLKLRARDYLERKLEFPGSSNFLKHWSTSYGHVCFPKVGVVEEVRDNDLMVLPCTKRLKTDCDVGGEVKVREIVNRLEADCFNLMKLLHQMSNDEKQRVRNVCTSLSDIFL